MSDGNDVWESAGSGTKDKDASGFSEHELLDIMYNTCNTANTGEVLASTIMQYLETMTAQSPEQDGLAALRRLLDPDSQNPHVSRENFHATMKEWIAQCSQDSSNVDSSHVSWPESSKVPVNGLDFSASQSKAASSESHQCPCDGKDLLGTVADLKHAHRKLSEQNSGLMRTVAQCEDINLQLTLEVTELRVKLTRCLHSCPYLAHIRAINSNCEHVEEALPIDWSQKAINYLGVGFTHCPRVNNSILYGFLQLVNITPELRTEIKMSILPRLLTIHFYEWD